MSNCEVKSVLLLSHELSRTGAPVALHYMAKQLKEDGVFVAVLSPSRGPMIEEIIQDDIPVIVDETISGNTEWLKWASNFDLIVVCTVVPYHNIEQLSGTNLPVLWWIHDAEMSFQLGANALLPQTVPSNIHVYGGGAYCCEVVNKYRQSYHIENLLYCVPDYAEEISKQYKYVIDNPEKKVIISSIASIDKRKGQDILAKAINMLCQEDIRKALFLFVGRNNDSEVYDKVLELKEKYPENVMLIEEVSRRDLADVYRQSNVVLCTSRDDPMPVIMTESLMLGVPVICSDKAGTYALLKDGLNGLTYKSEDVTTLKDKISFVINYPEEARQIGAKGRQVYEDYFTKDAFKKNLYIVLDKVWRNE